MSAVRRAWAATLLIGLAFASPAAGGGVPVEHEPIPPDPEEDLALRVSLEGDLPAAIHTPGGAVGAPDPLRLPSGFDAAYGVGTVHDAFSPDLDTRRPEVNAYDDPFTPSTAPFKRLEAFDAVRSDYRVEVRDQRLVPLDTSRGGAPPSAEEDPFYADMLIDVPPEGSVRIPSVGPGARIVHARLGVGSTEVPFRVLRDGAANWFLQPTARPGGPSAVPTRARLVMELAMPRAAFGGPFSDVTWNELPVVFPLPDNVARDAAVVRAAIGVGRAMRPRDAVAKLVEYFRAFSDADDPPTARGSVYLDLALSKKGVCRHRAYAFLVTAQSLGIPTRLVKNEAHAWVEVNDSNLWRRIDLGGAGQLSTAAAEQQSRREPYAAAPDAFPWPRGSTRGDEMMSTAPGAGATTGARASSAAAAAPSAEPVDDGRPRSSVSLVLADAVLHRGLPFHVRGEVRAEDAPCPHVPVQIGLSIPVAGAAAPASRAVPLVILATGDDGTFQGTVVPTGVALGDYDIVAETPGDARCGRGRN